MMDLVKELSQARLDSLFVLAGLLFLAVAVLGNISGAIQPGKTGRIVSAVLSPVLLVAGLWMHNSRGDGTHDALAVKDATTAVSAVSSPTADRATPAPAPVATPAPAAVATPSPASVVAPAPAAVATPAPPSVARESSSPVAPHPPAPKAETRPVADASISLSGSWALIQSFPDNTVLPGTLQIVQSGATFVGKVEWMGHRAGEVVGGNVDGEHVQFIIRYTNPDVQGLYEGAVRSSRRIEGSTRGGGSEARWSATRQ